MTFDELEQLCREAARDVIDRRATEGRAMLPTVVLPAMSATAVVTLDPFPDDDLARFELLSRFAAERMRPSDQPCYGFLAEARLDPDASAVETAAGDVVMLVCGARRHRPRVAVAPLGPPGDGAKTTGAAPGGTGLGEFGPSEELDPTAMPFLAPLQHAADAASASDGAGPVIG